MDNYSSFLSLLRDIDDVNQQAQYKTNSTDMTNKETQSESLLSNPKLSLEIDSPGLFRE